MQIVAALFADDLEVRQVEGPSTRLDFRGIRFSEAAAGPFPVRIEPHLFVLVRCGVEEPPEAVLEVRYLRRAPSPAPTGEAAGDGSGEGEQVARNVQVLQIEPGRFAYRLVRAELDFDGPGTVEAHCRIDQGAPVVVPLTMLPPAADMTSGNGAAGPPAG